MRAALYSLGVLAAALLAVRPAWSMEEELSRVQIARIGKAATALVEVAVGRGNGHGTAFCVHPSGLFVTNEHVVSRAGPAGSVTLVLDPSLKTQRVLRARVLRSDKDLDLALLRAEGVKDLPALALGSVEGLTELQEVTAFGFPFGTALGDNRREYPAVSINAGSITSLRHRAGALHRIQVDIVLNPGNSGGPVLDRGAKVVGVVVAGVPGARINLVIPVSHLTRFLARPEVEFKPPVLTRAQLHRPVDFQARAALLVPSAKPLSLELIITTPGGGERRFPFTRAGDVYRVRAIPVPAPEGPATLRVSLHYPNGSVTGHVVDRAVKVGGKEYRLSRLRSLRWQPAPGAVLDDGKSVEGPVTDLDALEVQLGKEAVRLPLASALAAQFTPTGEPEAVSCTLVVRQGDKEVARVSDSITVSDPVARAAADPGPAAIQPPALDGAEVARSLPAAAEDLAVGGGGRYLILHLPKIRQLAVFDVSEARVVKYLTLPEDNVKFAAGRDKLLVGLPGAGVLQRWSLTTFQREAVAPLPVAGPVKLLLTGSSSAGPLLVNGELVDVQTLKKLNVRYPDNRPLAVGDNLRFRASGDGTVFGAWATDISPSGFRTFSLVGDELKAVYVHDSPGHVIPGPDGKAIFTSQGLYTPEMKPLGGDNLSGKHYCVPAHHGSYYLTVRIFDQPEGPQDRREGVEVYMLGMGRAIARLPGVKLWEGVNGWGREVLSLDRRIHFIPDAKLIVLLPPSNDRLVLYRFDPEAALEKSGLNYLLVTSRPVTTARKGRPYSYRLVVKSKKGGLKYRLESAPDGMRITGDGRLQWDVPPTWDQPDPDVLITITDAGGQECFHSFKLSIVP